MTLQVLGAGIFMADELAAYPVKPAWRKATRNMIMATASIQKALSQAPQLTVPGSSEIGLILGSTSGELETSADFLTTWSKSKMARPLLFQNSLHNATTGFASIYFKITGPSFTMSAIQETPEQCVEMAKSLLSERVCEVCIVTLVEAHKTLANWIGESTVTEGACTLILSSKEFCSAQGIASRAEFSEPAHALNYSSDSGHVPLISIVDSGFFARAKEWGAGT